jgi:signal peptidase II
VKRHLTLTLAYNKGGAWGLLQDASETVRRPFFFAVSVLAVLFIVSLYSKLVRGQHSLTWGLPFVLGGALGNLSDRVTRNSVIDFIDYRADWVLGMNRAIARAVPHWGLTDHWPTFNIADVAICIGVGLMAVDMFTSRRGPERPLHPVGASQPPLG